MKRFGRRAKAIGGGKGDGALVITGGRVVDPSTRFDGVATIVVEDGLVKQVIPSSGDGRHSRPVDDPKHIPGARVLDASGKIVMPGLIDMHVHLREPGEEWKEDVRSGSRAAAAGGFAAVAAMANTKPPVDDPVSVEFILKRASEVSQVKVYQVAALSKGLRGEELAEIGLMAEAGAVAISDDGRPVSNSELLRCALEYAAAQGLTVISHPEDLSLSAGGTMNYGPESCFAGLRGMPAVAEEVMVARDVLLAGFTRSRLHLAHVSTAASADLVKWAKDKGFPVTAEVTPHHLILTDEEIRKRKYDTNLKMNPPLRTERDRGAVLTALSEGVLDVIATDHAPHHLDDKVVEFDLAAFGVSGLETAVGVVITALVEPGYLDWLGMAEKMSLNPARILGIPGGQIMEGKAADITIIDPYAEWVVDPASFLSKGKNTPFGGFKLKGRPWATIVEGEIVMLGGTLVDGEA